MSRFIASGLLAVLGLALAAYTIAWLQIGNLRQMGPGFFPLILSLAFLGLALLIALNDAPALKAQTKDETITLIATTMAILLFSLCINRLGLLLTVGLSALTFCLMTRQLSPKHMALTTLAVMVCAGLLFGGVLRIQINLLP